MKTFKAMLFGFVFLLAAGAVVASTVQQARTKLVTYHYTSTSNELEDMQDINNWQGGSSSCGSVGSIPCAFTYNGDFEAYLQTFESAYDLKEAADTRRTP